MDPADTSLVTVAYYSRGVAYGEKGEVDDSIEDYDQAIILKPDFADAYNNRGYAYYKKGNVELAIENYNQAINLKPDNVPFYINRGIALLHQQEWEKAKEDLTIVRNMGEDFIALFRNSYPSVADFEQKHGVKLPADITALLTPPQP